MLAAGTLAALAAPAVAAPQGPATFDPPIKLSLGGPQASFVATGDFDGDGRADVAAAGGSAVVAWLGTGDPTAPFSRQGPVPVGGGLLKMAADLNGDGRDDLAVVNANSDTVSILLGGATGLTVGQTIAVHDPFAVDAGDLDADGDIDLAVSRFGATSNVSILTNDGLGSFTSMPQDVGCGSTGVAIADLTGDGGQDVGVLCSVSPATVVILESRGGGLALLPGSHRACDGNDTGFDLSAGRFDSDGKDDLAVACETRMIRVLSSALGFEPLPGPNDAPASPERSFHLVGTSHVLLQNATGDVNGDGHDDVINVLQASPRQIVIADGSGDGRLSPLSATPVKRVGTTYDTSPAATSATPYDVNDDGKLDLVVAAGPEVVVSLNSTPIPAVRTGGASDVGARAATVGGTINASFGGGTTYRFEYGTSAGYGAITSSLPNDGSAISGGFDQPVSAIVQGLEPNTTYHYRIVAANGRGQSHGRDRTFTTGPVQPRQPGPAADHTAPKLALSAAGSIKRKRFLKKGIAAAAVPDEASTLAFELIGSTKNVRLARAGDVVLAERTLGLAAGRRGVTLRLPRRFQRGLSRRFTLTIRVTATDAAGNRTVSSARLKVR